MKQSFQSRQWVPYPIELVFAFFANPHNLPHMMPPELHARVEDVRLVPPPARPLAADPALRFLSIAAGAGTEILISFRPVPFLPQRLSWTARIAEFGWNDHFIDEQIRGPFKAFRHRHGTVREVREGVDGTVVSDLVDYELPLGVLGVLGSGIVRAQLKKAFAFRQERLPQVLAVALTQASRRA